MVPSERYEKLKKILPSLLIFVLALAVLGLVLYAFAIPLDIYIVGKLFHYVVEKVVSITGMSIWLAKGIVAIVLIPMFWVLPNLYRGKYKKQARAVGALYFGIFFLSIYFLSRDINFAHSGAGPLKWYALTPDGVKFYDSPGNDPVYGMPLKPVTPEVIRKLKLLQKGDLKVIDPRNAVFFNPITGEAQIWYHRYPDGTVEFYDRPGYHPVTGDPLEAVTKQIVSDWRAHASVGKAPAAEAAKPLPGGVAVPPGKKEDRGQALRSLINKRATLQHGVPNVALVIEAKGGAVGDSAQSALYRLLRSDRVQVVTGYFREGAFKSGGFFEEIYGGNTKNLKESGAMADLDYLLLGKVSYSFRKNPQLDQDLISCDLTFAYKVVDRQCNISGSGVKNTIGAGFTEEAALERAMEVLAEKHSGSIFRNIE